MLGHWLQPRAMLAGLIVLLAIIVEHKVGKMGAKKREANDRIEELEAATRPKPFDQRLSSMDTLNSSSAAFSGLA